LSLVKKIINEKKNKKKQKKKKNAKTYAKMPREEEICYVETAILFEAC